MSQFLNTIHQHLSDPDVSDIHLSPDEPIWIRKSGDMISIPGSESVVTKTDLYAWLGRIRYQSNPPMDVLRSKGGQDDFAANLPNIRIRMHVWISADQINVSARKLATSIPPMDSLGLPKEIKNILSYENGLVLIVGATGSGKSTTLAACLDDLNRRRSGHIITLEDPIEYLHVDQGCRVRQRQIGQSNDCVTFAGGVVAAMREDPDIIMVGEVRDIQTMQACLTASQTGHLVLATLHTNSAVETIERVLAFYPETERELARSVLSSVLRGVVAQRLVKTVNGKRALAAELMICNNAIRANINANQLVSIEQSMETGRTEGQMTMNLCLQNLYEAGKITRETALSASTRRDVLDKRLR